MYKHILVGTEGSELGDRALAHGFALAKNEGAKVTVVTVTEPWSALDLALAASKHNSLNANPNPLKWFEEMAAGVAKRILDAASAKAKDMGVDCDVVHVPNKLAGEGIIDIAQKTGCDLIVMASHGRRGIDRMLLGSQAYEVLTHCKVPALVVR